MSGAHAVPFGDNPRLLNRNLTSSVPNTENALVQITLTTSGTLQTTEGGGGGVVTNRLPEWWGQSYAGVNQGKHFEARLQAAGAVPTGGSAIGVWISMDGVAPSWQLFRNAVGTSAGVWTIEIRSAATGAVLTTGVFTVTCTKNP